MRVDERIVASVRDKSGRLITVGQKEVGGLPELRAGVAAADADGDGMSDAGRN